MRRRVILSLRVVIPTLLIFTVVALVVLWRYRTLSTLEVIEVGSLRSPTEEVCKAQSQLWPSAQYPFRAWSPNGEFYVEVSKVWFWDPDPRVLELYSASTGRHTGSYVSSDRSILVFCWAEDSSGIYVSDYSPSSGSIFIIPPGRPSRVGPVKKLLIPPTQVHRN